MEDHEKSGDFIKFRDILRLSWHLVACRRQVCALLGQAALKHARIERNHVDRGLLEQLCTRGCCVSGPRFIFLLLCILLCTIFCLFMFISSFKSIWLLYVYQCLVCFPMVLHGPFECSQALGAARNLARVSRPEGLW